MTWEESSPFSAVASAVTGILSAKEQGKRDKADADRQAELDRIAAVQSAATLAKTRADTAHIGYEESASTTAAANAAIQQGYTNTAAGFNMTPLDMPTPKPGQHFSKREQSAQYLTAGNIYTKRHETGPAAVAFAQAKTLSDQADAEDSQALAVKTEGEKEIQDLAVRHHMTQQEIQAAKDELGRMIREARQSGTQLDVAHINGANAMARTLVTQQGENTRSGARLRQEHTQHVNTEDNLNRRFNVGERRKTAAATTAAATQAGNKGYTRGVEGYNAIAKGATYDALPATAKAAIRSYMVDQGLSVDKVIEKVTASSSPQKAAILQALGGQAQSRGWFGM
jgi:hypothetical protein